MSKVHPNDKKSSKLTSDVIVFCFTDGYEVSGIILL